MDDITERSPHLQLTFHEANILMNIFRRNVINSGALDKYNLIGRISTLETHTEDPFLRRELQDLKRKIMELSEAELTVLWDDVKEGNVFFPPNYPLPKFTSDKL